MATPSTLPRSYEISSNAAALEAFSGGVSHCRTEDAMASDPTPKPVRQPETMMGG